MSEDVKQLVIPVCREPVCKDARCYTTTTDWAYNGAMTLERHHKNCIIFWRYAACGYNIEDLDYVVLTLRTCVELWTRRDCR